MSLVIRAFEFLAHHSLAAAVALRGFRGNPDDAHALAHAAVAQSIMGHVDCNGVCFADVMLDALERRRRAN
jgi:hypothetical protein